MMLVVVAYDVSTESEAGRKRLRRVAKVCEDVGQRVQNSVFECLVDAAQWTKLRARLVEEAEIAEDSLRFYFLGDNWKHRVEHVGAKKGYDPQGPLVV
jgi:CRISPR-associated protein Cas2